MASKQVMYRRHHVKTPYNNSPLDYQSPSHDPFIFEKLRIPIHLVVTIYAPAVGLIRDRCRYVKLG